MCPAQKPHKIFTYKQETPEISISIGMEKKSNAKEFIIFIRATCSEMVKANDLGKPHKVLNVDFYTLIIFGHDSKVNKSLRLAIFTFGHLFHLFRELLLLKR